MYSNSCTYIYIEVGTEDVQLGSLYMVLGDGCSLHDSKTPSSLLHVVPNAIQPPTPTTLPPSSLARTTYSVINLTTVTTKP